MNMDPIPPTSDPPRDNRSMTLHDRAESTSIPAQVAATPSAPWHRWGNKIKGLMKHAQTKTAPSERPANVPAPNEQPANVPAPAPRELGTPPSSEEPPSDSKASPDHQIVKITERFTDLTERKLAEDVEREFMNALHDSALTLSNTVDIEKSLDRILTTLARVIPYDSTEIMLFESGLARVVRSKGNKAYRLENTAPAQVVDQVPQLREVMATGQAIVIADTAERPGEIEFVGPSWVRSHISAPIHMGRQIIGFINVDSAVRGMFTSLHPYYLQAFADQAALAIENARLIAESQLRIRELSAMNRIQTSINSTLELDWVLRLTIQEVRDLFGVEECSLMFLDESANELYFQVGLGAQTSKKFRLSIHSGIAGWVVRTGNPVLVNDVNADPHWDPSFDAETGFHTRMILASPLKSRNKTIGVIELLNKVQGVFADADLRLLSAVSNLVAGAIENARQFGELNKAYQEIAQTQAQVLDSRNTL